MTPGSPEAVEKGCSCPILSNNHGRGAMRYGGDLMWERDMEYELHGKGEVSEEC